jgi:hypothetical protein
MQLAACSTSLSTCQKERQGAHTPSDPNSAPEELWVRNASGPHLWIADCSSHQAVIGLPTRAEGNSIRAVE